MRKRAGLLAHWLTLLGAAGKSSLTVQFVDGHFVESYYPTIENTFSKLIRYKGQDYATEIIDTAGQVRGIVNRKELYAIFIGCINQQEQEHGRQNLGESHWTFPGQ